MALPTGLREYEELYTLTPADQEFVAAHRISANRQLVKAIYRSMSFSRCRPINGSRKHEPHCPPHMHRDSAAERG